MKFLVLFRNYINFYRNASGTNKKSRGTIKAYEVKYSLVTIYLYQNSITDIKCIEFNNTICENLYEWLRKKEYSCNYSIRIVEICQAVITFGVKTGTIKTSHCYSFKLKREAPKEPPYLSPEQIKLLEEYQSFSSLKQKAATMFAIQIHTGFDYGDFGELRPFHKVSYKGREYIVKPRHKNGQQQVIPISEYLNKTLDKYQYNIKLLSNAKFNQYIKIVVKELGINSNFTTKDGRKIFFMNKLNNEGFQMEATSRMGGHKSIQTTEKYYAQVNINLISNELDRLGK